MHRPLAIADGLSSSSQPGNASLGTVIGLAIGAVFQTLATILKEGPASILTAAIVLFFGILVTFDRKGEHPFLTALFLAPVVGGCFLYALLLFMLLLSAIFGAGGRYHRLCGNNFPAGESMRIRRARDKTARGCRPRRGEVDQKIRIAVIVLTTRLRPLRSMKS